jgi:hypothetical protein
MHEAQLVTKCTLESDERCLRDIDEHELTHTQSRELRTELHTDRSSRAGDENGRAG